MSTVKSMTSLPMADDKVGNRKLSPFLLQAIMDQMALIIVLRPFSATSLVNYVIIAYFFVRQEGSATKMLVR